MAEDQVEDVEKAKAGAYAEKPFRDALKKYEANLPPDQKAALDWIASAEGEEAMAAYRETKSLEDLKIDALREKVSKTLWLTDSARYFGTSEEDRRRKDKIEGLVKRIGLVKVDRILTTKALEPEKAERIRRLPFNLDFGVQKSFSSQRPADFVEEMKGYGAKFDTIENTLLGWFAADIYRGRGRRAINALAVVGEQRHPAAKESKMVAFNLRNLEVGNWAPIISEVRQELLAEGKSGEVKWVNEGMEDNDFLWSPGAQSFVDLHAFEVPR